MARHPSLGDLRADIQTELRDPAGDNSRFSQAEVDLMIQRATRALSEYFWHEVTDESQTWSSQTYKYTYAAPIHDVLRVELQRTGDVPRECDDWFNDPDTETGGTDLYFSRDHTAGDTLRVHYALHPVAYPVDIVMSGAHTDSVTTLTTTGNVEWPSTGYAKVGSEIMKITAIDRSTSAFTVTRGALGTAAAAHSDQATISFVNIVDKEQFFDGVVDLSIAGLNRIRIIDAPASDIAGNVTVMREINEAARMWIRRHRQRSRTSRTRRGRPSRAMRGRRRGV